MKTFNFKSLVLLLVAGSVTFVSCADLSVQNVNEPTREVVEGNAENQTKLLAGGFYDLTTAIVSNSGVNINMLADQNTSTNNFNAYWDYTDEPRRRLNPTPSSNNPDVFTDFFGGFNSSVATANIFINNIVNEGQTVTNPAGDDVTDDILAQAYFLRGLAYGYLGLMYDQAYLIDENFVVGEDEPSFVPYADLIAGAKADLDQAISLAAGSSTFTFNSMPNPVDSWDADEFIDIANSFAARILAGQARTAAERDQLDWATIRGYAEKGLGGPDARSSLGVFKNQNIGSSGEFANYLADWSNFVVAGGFSGAGQGHGYNPTDVKVIHMMDPNYPVEYPESEASGSSASLAASDTQDPRIDYFQYTTNPGFLNPARNARLYSNYFSARNFAENDWWPAENSVIFFTDTENLLLLAEAQLLTDSPVLAAQTINSTPSGDGETTLGFTFPAERLGYIEDATLSGGYTMDGTESVAEFQWALLREYSVEIHLLGGTSPQWFLMRRHDMLQVGTATMLPVPGSELEIRGLDGYTFGGPDFAGDVGTSDGANSWKNLAQAAGLAKSVAKTSDVSYSPLQPDNGRSDIDNTRTARNKGAGDH
ncbi:hypothetical protein G3570_10245 [Balneolaceae bacterium YR4-1]|uniref:RagB/SusD family nutrient uptake outer membrane protein n=1 Tax=Halalkalibaculum roseum TaxID=2709311 RepID=A0A6M1T0J3_9BACT|nr:RagB/SusD family nutrient uptake outer membrane protein [Halalkalibaculum roseum]NGP77014.1 hypothetical protein [Halalkalibaculum roseum]